MAHLPVARVTPGEPPFTHDGVDLGPLCVESSSTVKMYGVIFFCLTLRVIHTEVALCLDSDSFINALKRFSARRGQVVELRSENGTNLIEGVENSHSAVESVSNNQYASSEGNQMDFQSPGRSHHGGPWQRLIRFIINSRPITKASMDPSDLEALAPNKLMLYNAYHLCLQAASNRLMCQLAGGGGRSNACPICSGKDG